MVKKFDLMIIGAGSGNSIPDTALERGETVAIIEKYRFGGTCLTRGCIPSKMLIASAEIAEAVHRSANFGVNARIDSVDWDRVIGRVWGNLDPRSDGSEEWSGEQTGFTVYKGEGRFVGEKLVEVNGERITADKIVVSAGGRPSIPPIPGLENVPYITSNQALRLPEQPRKLTVLGGGYIGCELAHFFGSLGTEVTIVDMLPTLVGIEDDDIKEKFTEVFGRKHRLVLNATVNSASKRNGSISLDVTVDGRKETIVGDTLLIAAGRIPNSDILDVTRGGIKTDERGYVTVNEYMETGVPGVWALGDIVSAAPPFKHVANMEARIVNNNIFNPDKKLKANYDGIGHAVFTSPQIAGVGMTEQQVKEAGLPYKAVTRLYAWTAYGWAIDDEESFLKLIVNTETRHILGAHIVGPQASILIQQLVTAVRLGLTVEQLKDVIYIHPGAPELIEGAILEA